jgi:uncharacterized protein YkwD
MRHLVVGLLAVIAVLTSSTSILAGPRPAGQVPRAGFTATADYCAEPEELAFLKLINDYRAQNGLGPLVLTQTLGAASEHHSLDMATYDYIGHSLHDGTSWDQNMTNHGYTYNTYRGENIAAGYDTAASVFAGWKASPGHNASMLSANFTAIGIGRVEDSTPNLDWYWTTDFGGYADAGARICSSGSTPTPQPTTTATAAPVGTATSTPAPQPTATSTVVPPTPTSTPQSVAYVASLVGKSATRKSTRTISVTLKIQNSSGIAVGGAAVTLGITAPDGQIQVATMTTNGRGQASWSGTVPSSGVYVASVTNVKAGANAYDPNRNVTSSVEITVK